MKYLNATFKNYIGFFNGMGLYEITIDFTKCQHDIILIQGGNGRGKSTIMNHLNPFPDSSNSFIPDKTAEKDLTLFSEGDTYTIQIISPADLKGRKTTKAYIQKNGIELNENGNISSYKDIIFSEFELDSNYISLSRLSNTDRGLGDKTPAERKKFISNIIDNLEIYNNIYKTLNKKSLIYKSHINTLHTKIQNIGDRPTIDQRLSTLRNKESELNSRIISLNNQIVTIQAKNSIDEEEAKEIQEATNNADSLRSEVDLLKVQIDSIYNSTKIKPECIIDKYNHDNDLYNQYTIEYNELFNSWKEKSDRLSAISKNIQAIEAELSSSKTDDSIFERYNNSNQLIDSYISELKSLDIEPNTSLILPLSNTINFCDKFVELLLRFNDNLSSQDIDFLINKYSQAYTDSILNKQKSIINQIENYKNEIAEINGKIKILGTLESRPDKCKIDTCPFISEAISLKKSLKTDLIEDLSNLQEQILTLSDNVTEIQKELDYIGSLSRKKMELDIIRSTVLDNQTYLNAFFPDFISKLDQRLIDMYSFNEIIDYSRLTDGLNLLKLLEDEQNSNKVLEAEYNGYRDKIKLINSSKVMLENLKKEQSELVIYVKESKVKMDSYNKTISELKSSLSVESNYHDTYCNYLDKVKEYNDAQFKVDQYQKKSAKALEALSNINNLRNEIDSLSKDLNPIMQDISTLAGQLTLLDSYYIEYNQYKSSYNTIETLKKYCSPTGGGIQTIFMQIYMSKTKQTANEVLSMLFNGSYQLLDFIINENEFRIPFIGEGLPVDDISSGSGAQISMMSMIINLVLLHQASTKFNISQLDELDGNLDHYNRAQFVNVLFYSMKILEIDQLFLISHSLEVDNTFADIVYLGGSEETPSGNIIWNFDIESQKQ